VWAFDAVDDASAPIDIERPPDDSPLNPILILLWVFISPGLLLLPIHTFASADMAFLTTS
jgi:hypothetical protein